METYSVDGARTWTRLQPADGARFSFADLAVDPRTGTAYVATAGGVYQVTPGATTAVGAEGVPAGFELGANFPNPFNGGTVIPFRLGRAEGVELTIYNAAGQRVRRLLSEPLPAGRHQARWAGDDEDGRPLATGLYFYRLHTESGLAVTRKLLILE